MNSMTDGGRLHGAARRAVAALAGAAALLACGAAAATRPAAQVVPDVPAATAAEPARVSPYTLASQRRHAEAVASAASATVTPSMRRLGQQGVGRSAEQLRSSGRPQARQ